MKILVIDDNLEQASSFATYATEKGHQVKVAKEVEQALKTVRDGFHPNVWLIDLLLKGPTRGSQLIRDLVSRPAIPPIVAITGMPLEAHNLPPGIRTLYKPMDPDDILDALEDAKEASWVDDS